MKKNKVLFIKKFGANAKFILNDKSILSENFLVKEYNTNTTADWKILFGLFSQFIFLLANILNTKLIYVWFADYHSFLPILFSKIFFKKSIICAGGYECTFIPEINCGVFTKENIPKRIRYFCSEFSLKYCSLILPVDETLINNTNHYIYSAEQGKEPLVDGLKKFIPHLRTEIKTIYLGYDNEYFSPDPGKLKEKAVTSAGLIVNDDEYRRKGFDLLVESAKQLPDIKFILAGLNKDFLKKLESLKLSNLELHGIISYKELIDIYRRSTLFAQISMFEGMPSTLCEAMLCECIPIGSNVNGIPKIIGDTGVVIYNKNLSEITDGIKKAITSTTFSGTKARKRIIEKFSLENRRTKLLYEVNNLLSLH